VSESTQDVVEVVLSLFTMSACPCTRTSPSDRDELAVEAEPYLSARAPPPVAAGDDERQRRPRGTPAVRAPHRAGEYRAAGVGIDASRSTSPMAAQARRTALP